MSNSLYPIGHIREKEHIKSIDGYYPFRILSLTIYENEDPRSRKILKVGDFFFEKEQNSKLPALYGKNVAIHAVVGKNGSGKSSLLDIFYRLVNNFSYWLMYRIPTGNAAMPLSFVENQYVKIEYTIDNRQCILECRGRELSLRTFDRKYRVGENNVPEWAHYEDVTGANRDKIREVMKNFFYTIVTNYALNAHLSQDLMGDETSDLYGTSFIDAIFHKNDGYRIPLVLNPYRNNGEINARKEADFAVERTIAILEFYKKRKVQFIDGYRLYDVKYTYYPDNFLSKFQSLLTKKPFSIKADNNFPTRSQAQQKTEIIRLFKDAFARRASYANLICRSFGIVPNFKNEVQFLSCCYVVYKTFAIVEKYDMYEEYRDYGNIKNCFALSGEIRHPIEETVDIFPELIKQLEEDTSHVTKKLRITLRFLRCEKAVKMSREWRYSGMTLDEYVNMWDVNNLPDSVDKIMNLLPITLFKPHLYLEKTDVDVNDRTPIPFESLSAGEKIYIYTLGTIVYHIHNIKSVSSKRIHYRNINIIMDELELSFHPEMQRTFVSKLVSCLTQLRLNVHCHYNIILVTHSPFVLSDVVGSNIMYLRDGRDVSDEIEIQPFGANINDVLSDNFFMGKTGFVGDIAQAKINDLVDWLHEGENTSIEWTMQSASDFINYVVGDKVIQHYLRLLWNEKEGKMQ